MTPRAWLAGAIVLVTVTVLVGVARCGKTDTPRASSPTAGPPATESSPPLGGSSTAPATVAPPVAAASASEAERLLRELEPLAVTDKPRALALALAADQSLPARGVMAEARRALIVTLMVDTDRMSEARERARAFIREYPTSAYLPLVQGTTGVHPRPRPSESGAAPRP